MNKRGILHYTIFGVTIYAIIVFIAQMWAANMIYDELQPELQKALMELGENVVCPPELDNQNFNICIGADGEVIVNGKVDERISLEINSNGKIESCIIHGGNYIDKKICRFNDFNAISNFDLIYSYKATTFKLNSKNFEAYIFATKHIKIPIKKWNYFWRVTRYIPK